MTAPLISVLTPSWQRHELLLTRAVPSVQAQDYPAAEHVIISDGPDENLRDYLTDRKPPGQCQDIRGGRRHPLWFYELPAHDPEPHYGWRARLRGLELAAGEYVTYCDDDDELRPGHCALMAAALDADPGAGFSVSRMMCHGPDGRKSVTGWGRLECGNVGSPMIMHRKSTLEHGTWRDAGLFEDWDLVAQWLQAGVRYVNVDAETSDVYPSRFRRDNK